MVVCVMVVAMPWTEQDAPRLLLVGRDQPSNSEARVVMIFKGGSGQGKREKRNMPLQRIDFFNAPRRAFFGLAFRNSAAG